MTKHDSADIKRERVWVGNEAREQEIISRVHWEADAALTSQTLSSQAP